MSSFYGDAKEDEAFAMTPSTCKWYQRSSAPSNHSEFCDSINKLNREKSRRLSQISIPTKTQENHSGKPTQFGTKQNMGSQGKFMHIRKELELWKDPSRSVQDGLNAQEDNWTCHFESSIFKSKANFDEGQPITLVSECYGMLKPEVRAMHTLKSHD